MDLVDKYLQTESEDELEYENVIDDLIIDHMISIDTDGLNDEEFDLWDAAMDDILGEKKVVKINRQERRQRARSYRVDKAKIKRAAKRRRAKPAFKRYKIKAKRGAKRGRTASGKRQVRHI